MIRLHYTRLPLSKQGLETLLMSLMKDAAVLEKLACQRTVGSL